MKLNKFIFLATFSLFGYAKINAQMPAITLHAGESKANVSPMLYGLMTEEINHSYDGGLYAELIRNRIFKDSKTKPEGWSLVKYNPSAEASIKLIAARRKRAYMMNAAMP